MKRFLSLLIVCLLLCSVPSAIAADYSSMTDAQLKEQYDAIRIELTVRGLKAENKTMIFDKSDFQIYISGEISIETTWNKKKQLTIPVVIINNSKKDIEITVNGASVNGWAVEGYFTNSGETPSGKKAKRELYFYIDDTDVEELKDFTDAEFGIRICDSKTWQDVLRPTEKIIIYANK